MFDDAFPYFNYGPYIESVTWVIYYLMYIFIKFTVLTLIVTLFV